MYVKYGNETYRLAQLAFGDAAINWEPVYTRFHNFKAEEIPAEIDERPERPSTQRNKESLAHVHGFVRNDRWLTILEIYD